MSTRLDEVIAHDVQRDHRSVFWGDRLLTLDKAAGFLDDPKFAAAFHAIKGSHVYDQYANPHTISWRLHTLVWAAQNAIHLDGDFVECGVFKGDMSWVVATVLGDQLRDKKFYLYDSFSGFDPRQSSEADFSDGSGFLGFANRVYREPGIEQAVRRRFASFANVVITAGFLPDSLDVSAPDRIAYLHMDLNSPKAEIACLERLLDRVVPGGMVVFDDYGWAMFAAQREAENSFLAARGYSILELPTGQGLVVVR